MRIVHRQSSAFTLLELILVMLILAIAAGVVMPSLSSFAVSRTTENTAQQILNLARYAETQAASESRVYRLNYDTQAGQVWLTVQNVDQFQPPTNDFGTRVTVGKGLQMEVTVTAQPATELIMSPNVIPQNVPLGPAFGQPVGAGSNTVMQIQHTDGTYTEFLPTGRTDPTLIRLTDRSGKEIDLGCATALERFHKLTKAEMQ